MIFNCWSSLGFMAPCKLKFLVVFTLAVSQLCLANVSTVCKVRSKWKSLKAVWRCDELNYSDWVSGGVFKRNCVSSLSAVLWEAASEGLCHPCPSSLVPLGDGGCAAGSTSDSTDSFPWQGLLQPFTLFMSLQMPHGQTRAASHTCCRRQQRACDPGGGCRRISSVGGCEPPNPAWISPCYYTCKQWAAQPEPLYSGEQPRSTWDSCCLLILLFFSCFSWTFLHLIAHQT